MKHLPFEAAGTYQVIVKTADGRVKYKSQEFKNLIVNTGIDRFMGNNIWDDWAYCGTGGTAPAVTDVGMQSYLAETNDRLVDDTESTYTAPRYMVRKIIYTFPVGGVVGNVAEVGIGWKNGSTRLVFSRSLVVDGGGSPTTITVLASEQLTIVYRFYVKVPDADTTFSVTDNGVTYTVTARQLFRSDYASFERLRYGFWGDISGSRSGQTASTDVLPPENGSFTPGSNGTTNSATLGAYTAGSFTRTINFPYGGAFANFTGGIGSACAFTGNGVGVWAFSFSPKINKIAGQSLTLSFNYTFVRGTPP